MRRRSAQRIDRHRNKDSSTCFSSYAKGVDCSRIEMSFGLTVNQDCRSSPLDFDGLAATRPTSRPRATVCSSVANSRCLATPRQDRNSSAFAPGDVLADAPDLETLKIGEGGDLVLRRGLPCQPAAGAGDRGFSKGRLTEVRRVERRALRCIDIDARTCSCSGPHASPRRTTGDHA